MQRVGRRPCREHHLECHERRRRPCMEAHDRGSDSLPEAVTHSRAVYRATTVYIQSTKPHASPRVGHHHGHLTARQACSSSRVAFCLLSLRRCIICICIRIRTCDCHAPARNNPPILTHSAIPLIHPHAPRQNALGGVGEWAQGLLRSRPSPFGCRLAHQGTAPAHSAERDYWPAARR